MKSERAKVAQAAAMRLVWQDPERRKRMLDNRPVRPRALEAKATGRLECFGCKEIKELGEFPKSRKTRSGQPRYGFCKPCHSRYQRLQRLKNFFNITEAEYDLLLAFQDGVCAICLLPPKRLRLAVDHDHKTGLIRGLLCTWCNRALGQFRDDMDRIHRTFNYFESPPLTRMLGEPRFGKKGRSTNKVATIKRLNKAPK